MQQRHQHTGQQDQQREFPHALAIQIDDAGGERGLGDLSLHLEGQEGKGVGDDEQDQPGKRQRQGAIETVADAAMQNGVTTPAVGLPALALARDVLQQVALVAGNQVLWSSWDCARPVSAGCRKACKKMFQMNTLPGIVPVDMDINKQRGNSNAAEDESGRDARGCVLYEDADCPERQGSASRRCSHGYVIVVQTDRTGLTASDTPA